MVDIQFERIDGHRAAARRTLVAEIYEASYVEALASGDPFDSVDSFMTRFDHYVHIPGFDMVIARLDDRPVGQSWGWPLGPSARTTGWWSGLIQEPHPGFVDEDGRRTFALSEIMVAQDLAGQGIAHALHDALLAARSEERATLLVEPDNERARRAYLSWGWQPVAQLQPRWDDAPLFDVLIRTLPLTNVAH